MPGLTTTDVATFTDGRMVADDPATEQALAAALAVARRYCGWHVNPVLDDQVLTMDGPGAPLLVLPTLNLVKCSKIVEQGVEADLTYVQISARGLARKLFGFPAPAGDSAWWYWAETLPRSTYLLAPIESYWAGGYGAIEVTMSHGYEDAPDWQSAVLSYLNRTALEQQSGGSREVIGPFQFGPATTASGAGAMFTPQERGLLDLYKLECMP
jgi:hypothetical protein